MDRFDAAEKSLSEVFEKRFNIPVFQRPYRWTHDHCQKLWDDITDFHLSEERPYQNLGTGSPPRYFLGPVVGFEEKKAETIYQVIDGQQRLTTLMLLLHALYSDLSQRIDRENKDFADEAAILRDVEKLLWRQTYDTSLEKNTHDFKKPILTSDVIGGPAWSDFRDLMGEPRGDPGITGKASRYHDNYAFFVKRIKEGWEPGEKMAKVRRHQFIEVILKCCSVLLVVSSHQTAALRIFDTLNNRGMQLRDTDIFKAKIYGSVEKTPGREDEFKIKWAAFTGLAKSFTLAKESDSKGPTDEIFRHLMHFKRGKTGIKTKEVSLRSFFDDKEKNGGADLLKIEVFAEILPIAALWSVVSGFEKNDNGVETEEEAEDDVDSGIHESDIYENVESTINGERDAVREKISVDARKYLEVLVCIKKNAYWRYLLTAFWLENHKESNFMDDLLVPFLKKTAAFTLQTMLTLTADEIRKNVYDKLCQFKSAKDYRVDSADADDFRASDWFRHIDGKKTNREISRALLLLHAYETPGQEDALIDPGFHIEHIFPKSWEKGISGQERKDGFCGINEQNYAQEIERFGNKVILEQNLNIGASDHYFARKVAIYKGIIPAIGYKGVVTFDDAGKIKVKPDPTNRQKKSIKGPSKIADALDICENTEWGKAQIDARDEAFKTKILRFLTEHLSSPAAT